LVASRAVQWAAELVADLAALKVACLVELSALLKAVETGDWKAAKKVVWMVPWRVECWAGNSAGLTVG
jgi:hypothetical protein